MTDEIEPAVEPAEDAALPEAADVAEPEAPVAEVVAPAAVRLRVTADGAGKVANGAIPDPNHPLDHVHPEGAEFSADAEAAAALVERGFVEVCE